jgi:hypothetical protein
MKGDQMANNQLRGNEWKRSLDKERSLKRRGVVETPDSCRWAIDGSFPQSETGAGCPISHE